LDLQPHGIGGEELAPIIHRRSPSTFIIMLSDRDDENYACLALKSGITGYLLKEKDIDNLASVVNIVFSGSYYISGSIAIKAINTKTSVKQFPGQSFENREKNPVFSSTERSIIKCIAKGFSDEKIADYLHLSTGTIRNYVAAIKQKTKTNNRVHTVIFSLAHGLISLEDTGIMGF
jgi:DNA-binding NarL/FixJ family response regulator